MSTSDLSQADKTPWSLGGCVHSAVSYRKRSNFPCKKNVDVTSKRRNGIMLVASRSGVSPWHVGVSVARAPRHLGKGDPHAHGRHQREGDHAADHVGRAARNRPANSVQGVRVTDQSAFNCLSPIRERRPSLSCPMLIQQALSNPVLTRPHLSRTRHPIHISSNSNPVPSCPTLTNSVLICPALSPPDLAYLACPVQSCPVLTIA